MVPTPSLGVKRLVDHLHQQKVPIAVATSSYRSAYDLKTQNHQALFSLFQTVVCGDDPEIKHGKPAPDIFLLAASRLKEATGNGDKLENSTKQFLVFEDSPSGVQAAVNAKMRVVWIPDCNLPQNGDVTADEVLGSMQDFDPSRWGLPPYPSESDSAEVQGTEES